MRELNYKLVEKAEHFNAFKYEGEVGDYFDNHYPQPTDPGYGAVSPGVWITRPHLFFVAKGTIKIISSMGPVFEVDTSVPPRLWHLVSKQRDVLTSDSVVICLMAKDKTISWERSREVLQAGEKLELTDTTDIQYIFVCSGTVMVGETEYSDISFVRLQPNEAVQAVTESDIIYAYHGGEFVLETSKTRPSPIE